MGFLGVATRSMKRQRTLLLVLARETTRAPYSSVRRDIAQRSAAKMTRRHAQRLTFCADHVFSFISVTIGLLDETAIRHHIHLRRKAVRLASSCPAPPRAGEQPYRFSGGCVMRHFDLTPLYRSTIGFDRLGSLLDTLWHASRARPRATRPTISSASARTSTASPWPSPASASATSTSR